MQLSVRNRKLGLEEENTFSGQDFRFHSMFETNCANSFLGTTEFGMAKNNL